MCKILLLIIIILNSLIFPSDSDSLEICIKLAKNFPRWLMDDSYQTSQTSGITFLRKLTDGTKEFLLADDIGKIHRFFITNDTVFTFEEIHFRNEVIDTQ